MKKPKKYTYLMLDKHPDQNEANYIGFSEEGFDSDLEAMQHYEKKFLMTSDTKIARIIAKTDVKLKPTY